MINRELINPQSIVVVGGSNNVHKPGGRLVRNLLDGKYKGELYVVNAKEDDVQGLKSYHSVHDIPLSFRLFSERKRMKGRFWKNRC